MTDCMIASPCSGLTAQAQASGIILLGPGITPVGRHQTGVLDPNYKRPNGSREGSIAVLNDSGSPDTACSPAAFRVPGSLRRRAADGYTQGC